MLLQKQKSTIHNTQYNTIINSERTNKIDNSTIQFIDQSHTFDVKKQLKDKFKTFTKWNYREVTQKIKKNKKKQELSRTQTNTDNQLIKALLSLNDKIKSDVKNTKNSTVIQQLVGIKAERRQRFKKSQNPLHFIKHYMQKQNFKPNSDEMYLIQKTIELKTSIDFSSNSFDLEKLLTKIYRLMNLAVDCNQLRFLNLLILLVANVCFQAKDYNRAFYFYNQSRLAATYANLAYIKTESLIGLGLIALQLSLTDEAIILFKKSLQYSWDSKNIEAELLIYDYIGESFYRQGRMKQSQYYHTRYIQGEIQSSDSAIKKISSEMLNDYKYYVKSLQRQNLTSLFIEYINIPIENVDKVPLSNKIKNVYLNYVNGTTPRITREKKKFDFQFFPDVHQQILRLLSEDYEFKTEISNPDTHRNFDALQQHSKKGKTLQFQQSSEFHRIIGTKPPKINFQKIYKYPLQQRIDRALSQKTNPNWWQDMRANTKKQRLQKVGVLKEKIRLGHLSYHKYPEQRKRAQSLKLQKIKESLNKTLLDWIDPVK